MSDPASAFYQTLVAAATDASQVLLGTVKMLDCVYVDYKPEVAPDFGQTLNVAIPAKATTAISDIGTGNFQFSTPTASTAPLVFDNHPGGAFTISDFSQFNTPSDVRRIFLDAYFKAIVEYIDTDLCSLAVPGNFTTAAISGSTAGEIVEANMQSAWGQLAQNRAPLSDLGNMHALTNPFVYANMLGDSYWTANSQIGYQLAGDIRRHGMLGQQWGILIDYDQNMPTVSTGSPAVTTYRNLIFHRWAIALALRPLPNPVTNVVESTTVFFGDLPIRVMLGYNQIQQGWVTTIDCGYARGVIRPEMGVVVTV